MLAEKTRSVQSPIRVGAGMCVCVCTQAHTPAQARAMQDMYVGLLLARLSHLPVCAPCLSARADVRVSACLLACAACSRIHSALV